MNTFQQSLVRSDEREKQRIGPLLGATQCTVAAPNSETGEAQIYGAMGPRNLEPPQLEGPFSWFRWMPDIGTSAIVQYRVDSLEPEIMRFRTSQQARRARLQAYREKRDYYRPLQGGTYELSSRGLAQTYWGIRANLDSRAGIVRSWKDGDRLEIGDKAPTHRRVLHQHSSSKVQDEERLGVVKRPISATKSKYVKVKGKFAKEWLVNLLDGSNKPLFDLRSGQVIDDNGKQVLSTQTGKPLRHLSKWFTSTNQSVLFEIDEDGNASANFPTSAKKGVYVNLASIESSLLLQVASNLSLTADKSTITVKDRFNNKIVLAQSGIYFFDSMGNSVSLANLVWHLHLGNLGAPTTPAIVVPPSGPGAIPPFTPVQVYTMPDIV